MSFRLIYKNKKSLSVGECGLNEKIYTNNTIFLGDTLNDCFNEIDKLKLSAAYPTGDTQVIIFSGGTRTIKDIDDI